MIAITIVFTITQLIIVLIISTIITLMIVLVKAVGADHLDLHA